MSAKSVDTPTMTTGRGVILALLFLLSLSTTAADGAPVPTTRRDFELPGTQPSTLTDPIPTSQQCSGCHAGYGAPEIEPYRNWRGSMMGQTGRDPLTWAAVAIANQDAEHAGEACIRCHLPKGWLEGRSEPEDGTALTADDREGVQCSICHRLVDPTPGGDAPAEDAAILAALAAPVVTTANAQMIIDPLNRRRGPFDVVADVGFDPHGPSGTTLVSPYHKSSELCGTCHNVRIPVYTRNLSTGEYEPNALDTPGDPALAFPEQSTYEEWAASEYASSGVYAPQFGGNEPDVVTCQDCHMPAATGRAASGGAMRDDVPSHDILGANTFGPAVIPHHPTFGGEVDADLLAEAIEKNTKFLRKAATVTATLSGGTLSVRVQNDSGHKLPTGYPEARRMWLHVRAYNADTAVVFESGRYVFEERDLRGHNALPTDTDFDPYLKVWEAVHGISPSWALLLGRAPGPSPHLALNNSRISDNRIPPRGFVVSAYEAFDGQPIPASYADGQYWDDVAYPVGLAAVRAEVVLYYQTTTQEYVEFLRDENSTNTAGEILFDLYDQHSPSPPVEMAHVVVETDVDVLNRCKKEVSKQQRKYLKKYQKEWSRCYAAAASGGSCDAAARDARIAGAAVKLRERIGGVKDKRCLGAGLTPASIGHGPVCPVPCSDDVVFDNDDLASCAVCTAQALGDSALEAGYGDVPPFLPEAPPPGNPAKCQESVAKAARKLAEDWTRALARCEEANATGGNVVPIECSTDPDGEILTAISRAEAQIARCIDFSGLPGCAAAGDIAGTQACVETAVADYASGYTQAAYP
jgi:hypothetical protein